MATEDATSTEEVAAPAQRTAAQQEKYDNWICRRKWSHWHSSASDYSMLPRVWPGQALTFNPNLAPSHGDGVLVLDWDGEAYFRIFSECDEDGDDLPDSHWRAHVLSEAGHIDWKTFDSRTDRGCLVLGVLTAVHGRWGSE